MLESWFTDAHAVLSEPTFSAVSKLIVYNVRCRTLAHNLIFSNYFLNSKTNVFHGHWYVGWSDSNVSEEIVIWHSVQQWDQPMLIDLGQWTKYWTSHFCQNGLPIHVEQIVDDTAQYGIAIEQITDVWVQSEKLYRIDFIHNISSISHSEGGGDAYLVVVNSNLKSPTAKWTRSLIIFGEPLNLKMYSEFSGKM